MRRDGAVRNRGGMKQIRNHTLVISGLLASLGPLIGNGLYSGAPSDRGEAIIKEFRDGLPTIGWVGLSMELVGFCALAVFISCLVVRLLAVAPVAAVTTGVAGSTMLAVKVGSAAPWMVVIQGADNMTAETAHTLIYLNGMAFVVSGLLLGLAFAAAGIGLLRTDTPRFLAWWPTVMGPLAVVAGIIGVASPDNYLPVPFLLLLIWMMVLAIATATRPTRSPANDANRTHSAMATAE